MRPKVKRVVARELHLVDYQVRRLGGSDVAIFRNLLDVFGTAFEDRGTYIGQPPSHAYLQTFLSRSDAITVAAFADDGVVGGLVAYVLCKFEQERSEVYIYDLAVASRYRRIGVATALIGELKRFSAEIGAYIIYVQADPGDVAAIALYESLGTREDVLHFDIVV